MTNLPTAPVTTNTDNPITAMQRFEMKYILTPEQTAHLRRGLKGRMQPDQFGLTSIASLYYDTPDSRLIRASLEKPYFKEKIRLRSYGRATMDSPVYLELKRKAGDVVYKRRIRSTVPQVDQIFKGSIGFTAEGQIAREIRSFMAYQQELIPACLIIYDRTAYFEPGGSLRLTIDQNPRYRMDRLDLTAQLDGISLLPPGYTILEIKVQDALPLWLTAVLSSGKIYKSTFSKYGEAYKQQLSARATYRANAS